MAPRNCSRLSWLTLICVGLGTFTVSVGTIVNAYCDSNCCYPPIAQETGGRSWPPDTTVTVWIKSTDFNQDEQNAIKQAFQNWQNAGHTPGNGSNVSFTYVVTPAPPVQGTAINQYIVKRGESAGGGVSNIGNSQTEVQSAVTFIDSEITNLNVMTDIMAHEIGHTFGLGGLLLSPMLGRGLNHGAENLQRLTFL